MLGGRCGGAIARARLTAMFPAERCSAETARARSAGPSAASVDTQSGRDPSATAGADADGAGATASASCSEAGTACSRARLTDASASVPAQNAAR